MRLIRLMWVVLAGLSFSIGALGIFLPLLPTTVFMLMAVYCASKGSPRFEAWIRSRHYVGPLLVTWEQEKAPNPLFKELYKCSSAFSLGV
ncbi:MAG: YbaN family protein [Halomonas sp.]|nr:YbaN family protein [Halomonas sp.]